MSRLRFVFNINRRERVGESETHRSPRDVTQPRSTLTEWSCWIDSKAAHLQDVRRARAAQALLPGFINGQLQFYLLVIAFDFQFNQLSGGFFPHRTRRQAMVTGGFSPPLRCFASHPPWWSFIFMAQMGSSIPTARRFIVHIPAYSVAESCYESISWDVWPSTRHQHADSIFSRLHYFSVRVDGMRSGKASTAPSLPLRVVERERSCVVLPPEPPHSPYLIAVSVLVGISLLYIPGT